LIFSGNFIAVNSRKSTVTLMGEKQMIYSSIGHQKQAGKKSFAVLLDPDKCSPDHTLQIVSMAEEAAVDYFFVGGSLMISNRLDELVMQLKAASDIPVILFPGSPAQITPHADALLYLSLISGRNPELLIGQHVVSAPQVKESGLEIMSTGYMIIDGGAPTTVSYMSGASPIPADKYEIAICTALAGEMLGMKLIYMDAGSGAQKAIPEKLIHLVSAQIKIPLIVGGGIQDPEKAYRNCKAGADIIVIGNAIEKDPGLIKEMASAIHSISVYS
jgi:putative glycerol-1-phosphate prenyltransferase